MGAIGGLFLVAAALLVISGSAKLRSPEPTAKALHTAGLPGPIWAVATLGAAEVAIGATALVTEARVPAAAMAGAYFAFAGFVILARRRGGSQAACGCFGRQEAPPSVVHLATCLALSAVASVEAFSPGSDLVAALSRSPLQMVVLAGYAAVSTWLVYVVLALLPRVREPVTPG